jgi:alpha-tubulin suppressor-like RCC1 family protein
VTNIAAGSSHVLAIKSGIVLCWGDDSTKQCSGKPVGLRDVIAVSAGNGYSLALKSTGQVIGWGKKSTGQVSIPPAARSHVVGISAGNDHALAVTDTGTVVAWGSNSAEQIETPLGLKDVYMISAGNGFSLALKRNGSVVGWGQNSQGQLSIPVTNNAVSIAAGQLNSVIGLRNGSVLVLGSAALNAQKTRTPTRTR